MWGLGGRENTGKKFFHLLFEIKSFFKQTKSFFGKIYGNFMLEKLLISNSGDFLADQDEF